MHIFHQAHCIGSQGQDYYLQIAYYKRLKTNTGKRFSKNITPSSLKSKTWLYEQKVNVLKHINVAPNVLSELFNII